MTDRLRDFTKMNPPIFIESKTSEDPQEFVDEVHKILVAMWGPQILRKQSWLPINSRMLHKLGARSGKIAEFGAEFESLGSFLRHPF